MFYTYVRKLPMVDGNLDLATGKRLEFSCGSIRMAKADYHGFRAFVLTDKFRDVCYRVTREGMMVERQGASTDLFIPNPGNLEELAHTPFAVKGTDSEINSFLMLCDKMVTEDKRRKSLVSRLRLFTREPIGKILIGAAILYGIITAVVLIFG